MNKILTNKINKDLINIVGLYNINIENNNRKLFKDLINKTYRLKCFVDLYYCRNISKIKFDKHPFYWYITFKKIN